MSYLIALYRGFPGFRMDLVAIALVIIAAVSNGALAASSLQLESLSAEAGDTISVNVRLTNDIPVRGVQFTLSPSVKSVLEYLGFSKQGPARSSNWTAAPLWRNDSLYTLLYSGGAVFEPGDTVLMSVRFRIKDNSYTRNIRLAMSDVLVIGQDMLQIPEFSYHDGTLAVSGLAPLPGDANGDGKTDVFDLLDLLSALKGKKQIQSADLNADGKVNVFDLLALLKALKVDRQA